MFAINVCAPTSGGHFHPAMTIAQVIFRGFPLKKAPLYILSQTFGAFLASLMVYASCRSSFTAYTAKLVASGHREAIFTPAGPAGTIAIFPSPGRDLAEIFANEFFADFLIALVIWSQLDAQNVFASPAIAPYTIGIAFAVVIWGMSYQTVVANSGEHRLIIDDA
jgi:glycerol uptake facilitator-like aquaporin